MAAGVSILNAQRKDQDGGCGLLGSPGFCKGGPPTEVVIICPGSSMELSFAYTYVTE